MKPACRIVLAAALLVGQSALAIEQSCVESSGTPLPASIIVGAIPIDERLLWSNIWGMRSRSSDDFRQCLFTDGGEFGWTWTKGATDPTCHAPPGESCQEPSCMYQFSFPSLEYGVSPWGLDTGAADMPVNVGNLSSLIVSHDVTYERTDDLPGQRGGVLFPFDPQDIYPRHALVYDLFLTSREPAAGRNVSPWITDEVIIMANYNGEYPNTEACDIERSGPIESDAVFDGFHQYDYHSFSDENAIGTNYHQFRRVGGESPGASAPTDVDLVPFLHYLRQRYDQPDLWLGRVVIGTQLYDHTHGSVTFHDGPNFTIEHAPCPTKCLRTIAKHQARFARTRSRALARCERRKIDGRISPAQDCDAETKARRKIDRAAAKLNTRIEAACHDESATPSSCEPGWGRFCPNRAGTECSHAINTAGDVATCVACLTTEATSRANDVYFDQMLRPAADANVVDCQSALGKLAHRFQETRRRLLQRCQDRRLQGRHSETCPDPAAATGTEARSTADGIARAESRAAAGICKACGGSDGLCGGGDDLDPQTEIGSPATCPDVSVPGGPSCAGDITILQDLVDCILCVTQVETDCMNRASLPSLDGYPDECSD